MGTAADGSTTASMWAARIFFLAGSLAAAVALCVVTGLIPRWGQWYSANSAYRRQTEALLHGSFALDTDPGRLGYDMAWAEGGVQQVWGLGVPAWRAPFEAAARLAGYEAFPDRLALAVALAIVIYVLGKLLLVQPPADRPTVQPERIVGAFLLVLFPPFLALCRTRFDVYEEAQAYMYLSGLGLFAATLYFVRRPGLARYAFLGGLAGLGGFVRPTLLSYGVASVALAWIITRQQGWQKWRSWMGPGLFVAACSLLLLTNAYRFGSPVEFGHSLNLNVFWPMMYATRIENPVVDASLLSRISELFSYLFLVRTDINCCNGYAPGILLGQAPVVRWRDIYFSTYDLTFLAFIAGAWIASFHILWVVRSSPGGRPAEAAVMGVWSFLGCVPLVVLYLNYPVMSSRYMMDFAPAFAVALWVLLQIAARFVRARAFSVPSESKTTLDSSIGSHFLRRTAPHPGSSPGQSFAGKCSDAGSAPRAIAALCAVFVVWWVYQIATARIFPETGGGVATRPAGPAASRNADLSRLDTNAYLAGTDFDGYGLPFNGYGWFADKKWIGSLVVLFLRDADEVELELSPSEGVSLAERDWSRVRIKIGLEWLTLMSSTPTAKGRRLVFSRPSKREHRGRVEVAFIALAPADQILGPSNFQIDAVRWRSAAHARH